MDRLCSGLVTGFGHDAPPKVSFACTFINVGIRMDHIFSQVLPTLQRAVALEHPTLTESGLAPEASSMLVWLGRSYSHIIEQCLGLISKAGRLHFRVIILH